MKLDPQVYRDAAESAIVDTMFWPSVDPIHLSAFHQLFTTLYPWHSEQLATALLFMAHITEDENEQL